MGMTITEKILAAHAGKDSVVPGELINADLDIIMCHDVTTPPAVEMLSKRGMNRVFDPDKVVVTPDHFVPPKDILSAQLLQQLERWVKQHNIKHYYSLGRHGVCHALLPEKGHILPGEIIVGGDSHTCTYGAFGAFSAGIGSTDLAASLYAGKLWFRVPESIKFTVNGRLPEGVYSKDIILEIIRRIGVDGARYMAMEYTGSTLDYLSMEARMTITNMAIEAGGKSGIIPADEVTEAYVRERRPDNPEYVVYHSDPDAQYITEHTIEVAEMEPMVAFPSLPSNGRRISDVPGDIVLDQAYIGSCTNSRIEDLRIAASMMKGKQVKVRTLVVPATSSIWKQANDEGLLNIFYDAGCVVSTATCGACLGGYMGVLGPDDVCLSTTNRNFTGRMGHPKSQVYLASPATVAAGAIEGKIVDPRPYLTDEARKWSMAAA
jgi:3-isopropylmalate/(R)-2-methylmalate dehydratase large subunit